MLKYVSTREEELLLLEWALNEAKYLKELIVEFENFPDFIKKNGEVHKGKQKARLKAIKDCKKELEQLKKFYIARRDEPTEWSSSRYSLKGKVHEGRKHLYKREDNIVDEGLQHPQ